MARHRLVKALETFDSRAVDTLFGSEYHHSQSLTPTYAEVQRVAIFAEAFVPKIDGVAKSAYMTLRYLQQSGREVMVFAPQTAPTRIGQSAIIPLPSMSLPFAPETMMAFPDLHIKRHLDAFQPDLIHLFSPALMSASGMYEAHQRGIPVVANYQTDLPGYAEQHYGLKVFSSPLKRWLRYVHNRCHLNLVASPTTLTQLRDDGYRRLRLWRRGVDLTHFAPSKQTPEWRARLLNGRNPNALLCVYVGRLAPEKRLDLLLEVARTPGVALTIIGDGASRESLAALFGGTNAHFTGYLVGDDLAHAYASADAFIFPGPNETFGQVVQEAMASGLPSIVVNQGGVRDLVEDGVNGILCPPSATAFAQAVITLRDNYTLRTQMAYQARQMAEARPWSTIMHQLEEHYSQALLINSRYHRLFPAPNGLPRFLRAG